MAWAVLNNILSTAFKNRVSFFLINTTVMDSLINENAFVLLTQGKRIKTFEFIPTGVLVSACLFSAKLVFAPKSHVKYHRPLQQSYRSPNQRA